MIHIYDTSYKQLLNTTLYKCLCGRNSGKITWILFIIFKGIHGWIRETMFSFFLNYQRIMLYIYLGFIVPLKSFSLMWRRHYWLWRTSNFDLYSALFIDQWRFLIVPRLLWHGLYLFIFEYPWHSHLCPDRISISRMQGERSKTLYTCI